MPWMAPWHTLRFFGTVLQFACSREPHLSFPRGRGQFLRECLAFEQSLREDVAWNRPEQLLVILPWYRRTWARIPMLHALLRCPFVEKIIVTLDGDGDRSHLNTLPRDPRLTVYEEPLCRGPGRRFHYALQKYTPYVLSLDDDLLLTPRQIRALFLRLLDNPSVPHGIVCQTLREHWQQRSAENVFRNHREDYDGPCDILNRAYAFTAAHARAWLQRMTALGVDDATFPKFTRVAEDVVLSFCGERRPRCHALGPFLSCPTAALPGVALHREPGFWEERWRIFRELRQSEVPGTYDGAPRKYERIKMQATACTTRHSAQ